MSTIGASGTMCRSTIRSAQTWCASCHQLTVFMSGIGCPPNARLPTRDHLLLNDCPILAGPVIVGAN